MQHVHARTLSVGPPQHKLERASELADHVVSLPVLVTAHDSLEGKGHSGLQSVSGLQPGHRPFLVPAQASEASAVNSKSKGARGGEVNRSGSQMVGGS